MVDSEVISWSTFDRKCGSAKADIDFEHLTMRVTQKVVNGHVRRVKTEYSEDDLPLDSDFAAHMLYWKQLCPPSPEDWVFHNPVTCQPYYASEIQKDYLWNAFWPVPVRLSPERLLVGKMIVFHRPDGKSCAGYLAEPGANRSGEQSITPNSFGINGGSDPRPPA